jgi:hypothetical protein
MQARLRVQAAIPFDNRGPVDPGTEYYAHKVNLQRSRSTGAGSCAGCGTSMQIELVELQLFQPPESNFDPAITTARNNTVVQWQEGPTAVQASLVRSAAEPDRVSLEWELSEATRATLYRREGSGPWLSLVTLLANGSHRVTHEDRTVTPGAAYHYRLGLDVDGVEIFAGETSVSVPAAFFAIEGARWESGAGAISVAFTLPARGAARLEVYDVSGRRIVQQSLKGLRAGRNEAQIRTPQGLGSGVYFLRLSHDERSAGRRLVLWR